MTQSFEEFVTSTARELPYPPMKAGQTILHAQHHMLGRVAVVLLVIGLMGFAVPDIRAAVLNFFQIGAITITLDGFGADGEPLRLADVAGETRLDAVPAMVDFDVLMPADDAPDRVFVQDGTLVIFIWLDADHITQALYQVADFDWGIVKDTFGGSVESTHVHGVEALWLNGRHPVRFTNGTTEFTYFVTGNVLLWATDNVTYRLETTMSLDAARTFAESLVVMSDALSP